MMPSMCVGTSYISKHDRIVERKRHWKNQMSQARRRFKQALVQYRGAERDLLEEIEAMDADEDASK